MVNDGRRFSALAWHRGVFSPACTLDPQEACVILAIVRRCDADGHAFPGIGSLAQDTRVSRTKTIASIAELEARGLLSRERQTRGAGLGSNQYTLPAEPPPSALGGLPRIQRRGRAEASPSAPGDLGSAPGALGVVRPATLGSAPGAPYLLKELPTVTAQGSGAPKPPRKRSARKASRKASTDVPFPDDFAPTEAHRDLAAKHGLDVELEAIACRGHYEGKLVSSPNGRFTTWLANQARWNKQRGARGQRKGPLVQRGVAAGVNMNGADASWLDEREPAKPTQLTLGAAE